MDLDKTEMLMNLRNRMLSTEIEYYQENGILKKKKKKNKLKIKGISKHYHYFQN